MRKYFLALTALICCTAGHAQTIKTDVLVIGGSPSGVAAAIQCARSKVKTVLIEEKDRLCLRLRNDDAVTISADAGLPSGIWGEFRRRIKEHDQKMPGFDTTFAAPLKIVPDTAAEILTRIADTVKNLTVSLNTQFTAIRKDDDRWEVTIIKDGKKEVIKPRVLIDATEIAAVVKQANVSLPSSYTWNIGMDDESKLYRTSIACGDTKPQQPGDSVLYKKNYFPLSEYFVPVKALIAKGADNLLVTEKVLNAGENFNHLAAQLTLGQGAGVTAAYCAFFKTTIANLNIRMIQGELQDFKGYLLPLTDITKDPYWRAMQQICASGLLKGVEKTGKLQFYFVPDSIVTTAEIKPAMLELYTRSFIWFNKEKPGKEFTIGNLLSFISELTLTDPDNLTNSISKAWTEKYHFASPFDPDRPITRREFAILANRYLNPFGRTIDMDGKVVN